MSKKSYDFIVIGAGIIGLAVADRLRKLHAKASILILEKEKIAGEHASGRNSGVIHAGFYYTADSMKAKFTRQGNLAMHQFCEENKIAVNKCGKLVVAKNEEEDKRLDLLWERGQANDVPLEMIDKAQAIEIEPRVKTHKRALFSPSTSSVNPTHVVDKLAEKVQKSGTEISYGESFLDGDKDYIITDKRVLYAGYILNCAGSYADKIANSYGQSKNYKIMPFKGLYLYSDEKPGSLRTNIYPVPDLNMPFLGVHFTLTQDNHIKIGPTAIPALWNEQYQGLDNFSFKELMQVCRLGSVMMIQKSQFRQLAGKEIGKFFRKNLVGLAEHMLEGVKLEQFNKWGRPGIRAQLVHLPSKKLEMDFVIENGEKSLHVLNAVSPAFTCSVPFAEHICNQIPNV